MYISVFVSITGKANSVTANNIAEKRNVDCKEQWTKDRPLGKTKTSCSGLILIFTKNELGSNCLIRLKPEKDATKPWMPHSV